MTVPLGSGMVPMDADGGRELRPPARRGPVRCGVVRVRLAAQRPCRSGCFRLVFGLGADGAVVVDVAAGVAPAVAIQAPGSVVGDRRADRPSRPATSWADPPERDGDQVVPGVLRAARDPHGSLFVRFCCAGGCFVDMVLAGGGHGVLLFGLFGSRRSSGGPITAVIGARDKGP